jgi:hypothetical protein
MDPKHSTSIDNTTPPDVPTLTTIMSVLGHLTTDIQGCDNP